jgi:hypothetical protein
MGYQTRKHNIKKTWQHYVLSSLIVYLHDLKADWELQLAAAVQHHERVLDCISLAQEKIKIQN